MYKSLDSDISWHPAPSGGGVLPHECKVFGLGLWLVGDEHIVIKNCIKESSRFYSWSDINIIIKVKLVREIN